MSSYVPFSREDPHWPEMLRSYVNDLFIQDLFAVFAENKDRLAFDYLSKYVSKIYEVKPHIILPLDLQAIYKAINEDLRHFGMELVTN